MSGWKDWDKLLGPEKESESSGGSFEPDVSGRKGSVVIRRRSDQVYFSASFLPAFKLSKLSIVLSTSE